jgi:DNA excision repair protein ERCC-2
VEEAPSDWKGTLLLFSRGRRSEGINVEAEAVVIAGAPYLPPYIRVEKIGITHDETVAIITIQNIGRVLRKPENNPLIILADERYLKLKQFLSDNFQFVEVNDLQGLDRLLKERHNQNQQQST